MKIKIKNEDGIETLEVDADATVSEALSKIDINEETVIVERDGKIISSVEKLKDKDTLELISVVSGG